MARDVTNTAEFLAEAASLAARLLERGRSIFDIQYDGLAFGNWRLTAGTPKRRVAVTWDGREGILAAKRARFADWRSRPVWQLAAGSQAEGRSPAVLLRLAEQIILAESDAPAA